MKKAISVFFSTLFVGILACGTTTPRATPEPVPDTEASTVPEATSALRSNPVVQPEATLEQTLLAPSRLRVVYVQDGNLWSWTEAGGSVQLTDSGDMSAVHLSADGQILAFVRGREVWTVRMDGKDARFLSTLNNDDGCALWLSPDGSLLAVSTKDHIDVIDIDHVTSTTVVTYPTISDNYYPEVVWSPDGIGFKTVVPPQADMGQAELLFVFTDGTVASLAKFAMVQVSDSLPYISADGGYIIYVAKLDGDKESLYLMDSSGATRPYGESGENIRAYGWLPGSKQFVYGSENSQPSYLGNIAAPPMALSVAFPAIVRWVNAEYYLALKNGKLTLRDLTGANLLIGSGVTEFDFTF